MKNINNEPVNLIYRRIAKRLNKNNFYDFMDYYELTYNEMLGIIDYAIRGNFLTLLQTTALKELLEKMRVLVKFNDSKLGVISDLHIGNIAENFDYINRAFNLFSDNGITSVICLGDLLDGYSEIERKRISNDNLMADICYKQILDFALKYPEGMNTYTILGNHEDKFETVGLDVWKLIDLYRKDFHMLGYGASYIDFNGAIFYLEHPVKCSRMIPPKYDYDLLLKGHSHFFKYREELNALSITTCSDVRTAYGRIDSLMEPGCAIISNLGDSYQVEGYAFLDDKSEKVLNITKKKNIKT